MRNLFGISSFLFVLFIFFSPSIFGQIKVGTNGSVGMGNHYENGPVTGFATLDVRGPRVRFDFGKNSEFFFEKDSRNYSYFWGKYSSIIGKHDWKFLHGWFRNLHYTTLWECSDKRIKENIKSVGSSLGRILKVRPVTYDLKETFFEDINDQHKKEAIDEGKNQSGVIAQELMEVFPHLVQYNGEADLYEVDYIGITPYLIKAIQEQQGLIKAQQAEMKLQAGQIELQKVKLAAIEKMLSRGGKGNYENGGK